MRQEARLRLTEEDRQRAQWIADQIGAKSWMAVVLLVLQGELEAMEGRLDERGLAMLEALKHGLTGRKSLPTDSESPT